MSGKVIQVLRVSPLLAPLSEAELMALASCGRIHEYALGQAILEADGRDERLFILRQGRVALHFTMRTEGGKCGGEAEIELSAPGEAFGWAAWVRPDHIGVSARALEMVSLVALELNCLRDSETLWKVSGRMLLSLYARLQEGGLCPPNVQELLALKQPFSM